MIIPQESDEKVILVDEKDSVLGSYPKLEAHQEGLLHRALSVFIFSKDYQKILLQQRAMEKYHSGGLWTNTCCSHPRPDEDTLKAAERRLMEEMGIATPLTYLFPFTYKAWLDKGLIEHEYDHIFIGTYEGNPIINKEEAMDWKWIEVSLLNEEIKNGSFSLNPNYTFWFKAIIEQVLEATKLHTK